MSGSELGFDVVYRGQTRNYILPGTLVFFQRPKECGGGYWLGRAYDNAFIFELEHPVSLSQGMDYILIMRGVLKHADEFDDDFTLT
ncbi:hypothetical protein AV650_07205 [Serratia fonticola]|nr:hypothetical protein AV650_07205 [Serratia fonticola]